MKPAPVVFDWEPVAPDVTKIFAIEYRDGRYRFLRVAKFGGIALVALSGVLYFDDFVSLKQVMLLLLAGVFFLIGSFVVFGILKNLAKSALRSERYSIRIDETGLFVSTGKVDTLMRWRAFSRVMQYNDVLVFRGDRIRAIYLPIRLLNAENRLDNVLEWCRHNEVPVIYCKSG